MFWVLLARHDNIQAVKDSNHLLTLEVAATCSVTKKQTEVKWKSQASHEDFNFLTIGI